MEEYLRYWVKGRVLPNPLQSPFPLGDEITPPVNKGDIM
jgi:hypothetical protein